MILTLEEAARQLKYDSVEDMDNEYIQLILKAIDSFIIKGTGFNWSNIEQQNYPDYNQIHPTVKLVASMLLVQWFDNPDGMGKKDNLDYGITNLICQLQTDIPEYVEVMTP